MAADVAAVRGTERGQALKEGHFQIYFAPLEGITGYIYRTTYEKYYGGVDKYFSPFVVTRDRGIMKKKELKDILPENNPGIVLVPQILTNQADNFIQIRHPDGGSGLQGNQSEPGLSFGNGGFQGKGSGLFGRASFSAAVFG